MEKELLEQRKEPPKKRGNVAKRRREDDFFNGPSTSTGINQKHSKQNELISIIDSQTTEASDSEDSSPWTNTKDAKLRMRFSCPHCSNTFSKRCHLVMHIEKTCLGNPNSKANKEAGRFKCTQCGRTYKEAKCLRYHRKHECQRTETCPDCGVTVRGFITERHKQNCTKKRRKTVTKQKNEPQEELFVDDSSIDSLLD